MEALSSFAISIAANIVCSLFPKNTTERDIRKAFDEAVEEWCPNEIIRRHKETDLHNLLTRYIGNPNSSIEALDYEMRAFIAIFQRHIAAYPAASNYLGQIKSQEYYSIICKQLHTMDRKIEHISELVEENRVKNEDLHFEAVAEINTVLAEGIEARVKGLMDGIVHLFGESLVTTELITDQTVILRLDPDSRWMEDEEGDLYQPKYQNLDYDWEQERSYDWHELSECHIAEILEDAFFANFQIEGIEFLSGMESLRATLNQATINEQLSIEEKKQITHIIQSARAFQAILNDRIFVPTNLQFKNLQVRKPKVSNNSQDPFSSYVIVYDDGEYIQTIDEIVTPIGSESQILEVWTINPDFIFKLSTYLFELTNGMAEWREMSSH